MPLPLIHGRPFCRHITVFLFLLACLLVLPDTARAREPASYPLTLTNQSNYPIRKIVLLPYGLTQIHTNTRLATGEKIGLSRPECEKMKMEITHDKGRFSFPATDFSGEKDITLSLWVRKDGVPVLKFDGRKRGEIAGDNSDWRFPQILGSIPFGIGVTTLAEASELGVKTNQKKGSLETTLSWGNRNWKASLVFSGDTPDSKLIHMEMTARGAPGKTPHVIHDALMAHSYVYYSIVIEKGERDLYVTIPMARVLEKAGMNGRNPADTLMSRPNEVIVQSYPRKGMWIITMTRAPDLLAFKPVVAVKNAKNKKK